MRLAFLFTFLLFPLIAGANLDQASAQPQLPPGGGETTIEEFLQKLSTVPGVVGRKDPFVKAMAPYLALLPQETFLPQSDLERYDLKDYKITAVLLGDVYSRALVMMPNKKTMIVREQDHLGNRGGVVTKISRNGVVVQQIHKSFRGASNKTEVTLPVGGAKQ